MLFLFVIFFGFDLCLKADFLQISTLISFSARFVTRWPRKEQPSVESGPISNLLFSCCLHEGFSIREVKNSTLQILFLKWKPRPFKVDFRLIRESNSCKNMQANSQNRNSHSRKKNPFASKDYPVMVVESSFVNWNAFYLKMVFEVRRWWIVFEEGPSQTEYTHT